MDDFSNPTRDQVPSPDGPQTVSALSAVITWVKRRWGLTVAIIVPMVTIATIVIPLVADASTRVTSAETLVVGGAIVTAEPADGVSPQAQVNTALYTRELIGESIPESYPNGYWRVAANAPWETFPLDPFSGFACSANQLAWLSEWGRRDNADVWNGYLTLENTASDGSSMSVRNIRSVGTFLEPPVPEVNVECTLGIGGMSTIIPLEQDLGSSTPAVFALDYGALPAGSPATLNMSPGQYLQLVLHFNHEANATADFSGSLVADVVVGDTTTPVVLFEGFTRSGRAAITTTRLSIFGDELTCDASTYATCTLEQFMAQLAADPAYPR